MTPEFDIPDCVDLVSVIVEGRGLGGAQGSKSLTEKFNDCHNPDGTFCSTGGDGGGSSGQGGDSSYGEYQHSQAIKELKSRRSKDKATAGLLWTEASKEEPTGTPRGTWPPHAQALSDHCDGIYERAQDARNAGKKVGGEYQADYAKEADKSKSLADKYKNLLVARFGAWKSFRDGKATTPPKPGPLADPPRLGKKIDWVLPDVADPQVGKEIARATRRLKEEQGIDIPDTDVAQIIIDGKLKKLSDKQWRRIVNTPSADVGHMQDIVDYARSKKRKVRDILAEFLHRRVHAPMVLKLPNQINFVVNGNTRLMICRLFKIRPRVWWGKLKPKDAKGHVPYEGGTDSTVEKWDPVAAEKNLREWSAVGDIQDWQRYRRAFAWYDPKNQHDFDSYRLIHHEVQDCDLALSQAGVISAMETLLAGDADIPEEDREDVYQHLAKHYRHFGLEAPELAEEPAKLTTAQPKEEPLPATKTDEEIYEEYKALIEKGIDGTVP